MLQRLVRQHDSLPLANPRSMIRRLLDAFDQDPLAARADALAATLDAQLAEALPRVAQRVTALRGVDPRAWRRVATIAAAAIAIFPLLQTVGRDPGRFTQLRRRVRAGLKQLLPGSDALFRAAEQATVLPTGTEGPGTINQIQEAMGLAAARWVLAEVSGPEKPEATWDEAQELGRILTAAATSYWRPA
jgi:hypothetical protein